MQSHDTNNYKWILLFFSFCSNIQHMREQFDALGLSFTWERVRFSLLEYAALFYCTMEYWKVWNFKILNMTT